MHLHHSNCSRSRVGGGCVLPPRARYINPQDGTFSFCLIEYHKPAPNTDIGELIVLRLPPSFLAFICFPWTI
jgi:hypothetical protein